MDTNLKKLKTALDNCTIFLPFDDEITAMIPQGCLGMSEKNFQSVFFPRSIGSFLIFWVLIKTLKSSQLYIPLHAFIHSFLHPLRQLHCNRIRDFQQCKRNWIGTYMRKLLGHLSCIWPDMVTFVLSFVTHLFWDHD